jgi:uncharacterized protein (DUF488 family)
MQVEAFSFGFSNRSWEDTLKILDAFQIRRLIDIRTLPGSRRTPQFNLEQLQTALPAAGIEYLHRRSLGGLRKPKKESTVNAAWKNDGFRGYADYMQTSEYEEALTELALLIEEKRSVFCCTEAVFWRCHRQLVADSLVVRGYRIQHILNASKAVPHRLTPFARLEGTKIAYPGVL